jgi:CheY-like chemotaxis protein
MNEPFVARRILVVDDNQDAARSLAQLLHLLGHDVATAHDGFEAVELAASFRPDVVLLDVSLPGLGGHVVARRIREQPWGRNMLLVAATGWGRADDRRQSLEAGFDHHLVKPVDLGELVKLVAARSGS